MTVKLLRGYLPKAGEGDLRGVEWRYLWQESQSDELQSFPHSNMVDSAVLTLDGRYLVTSDWGGTIRVWEVASTRKILESEPKGRRGGNPPTRLGISADGKWLAAPGKNSVEIWDTTAWTVIRELKSVTQPVRFSPDSSVLATTGTNGVWLWDLRNWTHRELTNALPGTSGLAFSPDGSRMASSCWGGQVQLWDPRTGMEKGRIAAESPDALDISPDGKLLACGGWYGEISLWELSSLKNIVRFRTHPIDPSCANLDKLSLRNPVLMQRLIG